MFNEEQKGIIKTELLNKYNSLSAISGSDKEYLLLLKNIGGDIDKLGYREMFALWKIIIDKIHITPNELSQEYRNIEFILRTAIDKDPASAYER